MGLRGGLPPTMGSCLTGRETRSIALITFNSRWVSSLHCALHTRASRPLTCCKTSSAIMLMLTRSSETHNRTIDASKTPVQDGPLLSIYLHNSASMAGQVSVESVAIQRQQIHLPYYWSCCWTSIAINMCKKCKTWFTRGMYYKGNSTYSGFLWETQLHKILCVSWRQWAPWWWLWSCFVKLGSSN